MMNQQDEPFRESLSALMDGELTELELQRLLKRLPDDAARAQWSRYQCVSAVIQSQTVAPALSLSFADRVRAAVQEGVLPVHPDAPETVRESFGFAKWAVAASVMLAVVSGVQWQQSLQLEPNAMAVVATSKQAESAVLPVPLLQENTKVQSAEQAGMSVAGIAQLPMLVSQSTASSKNLMTAQPLLQLPGRAVQYRVDLTAPLSQTALEETQ